MGQINNGKMLIANFDLKENDIQALKLNDKIRIDNSWWNINKVIDYDANARKFTRVELISIDNEINFTPFMGPSGPIVPVGPGAIGPMQKLAMSTINTTRMITSNVFSNQADAMVMGRGNVIVGGTRSVVVGDGYIVSENEMVTDNLITASINGEVVVNSTKYIATLLQSSTTDPLATVLENTLGDIVWTRFAVGVYRGTLSGAFPDQDRTYVVFNNTVGPSTLTAAWKSVNEIEITTYDISTSALADDLIGYSTIEIRTY